MVPTRSGPSPPEDQDSSSHIITPSSAASSYQAHNWTLFQNQLSGPHSLICDTTAPTMGVNSHCHLLKISIPPINTVKESLEAFVKSQTSVCPTWVVRLACFCLGHSVYFPLHFFLSLANFNISPPLRNSCQAKAISPSLLCCLDPCVFKTCMCISAGLY